MVGEQTGETGATPVPTGPLSIDLFSARGFLGGSEYERYYLSGAILWRECGSIASGAKPAAGQKKLEGDEVLSTDPQLKIEQRRVERLSAAQAKEIRARALEVLALVNPETKREEPPPGSVFSLSAPGLFEMLVQVGTKKERVISSVDAVAEKRTATLEKAHELFSTLRGVGPTICGSTTFYGIDRKS